MVLDHLNLKDQGQLNDKFDGVSYYNSVTRKLFSYSLVFKYIYKKEFSFNQIDLNSFKPIINFKDKKFRIITSDFGEFPLLDYKEKIPFIYVARKSNLEFIIVGYSSTEVLEDTKNYELSLSNRRIFKALDKLNSFNNGI